MVNMIAQAAGGAMKGAGGIGNAAVSDVTSRSDNDAAGMDMANSFVNQVISELKSIAAQYDNMAATVNNDVNVTI